MNFSSKEGGVLLTAFYGWTPTFMGAGAGAGEKKPGAGKKQTGCATLLNISTFLPEPVRKERIQTIYVKRFLLFWRTKNQELFFSKSYTNFLTYNYIFGTKIS